MIIDIEGLDFEDMPELPFEGLVNDFTAEEYFEMDSEDSEGSKDSYLDDYLDSLGIESFESK